MVWSEKNRQIWSHWYCCSLKTKKELFYLGKIFCLKDLELSEAFNLVSDNLRHVLASPITSKHDLSSLKPLLLSVAI